MEKQSNISNLGELDVIYKYQNSLSDRPTIKTSDDAILILKDLYSFEKLGLQEQFVVIFVNRSNTVIGCTNLFSGGISGTVVDVKIVIAMALKLMATSILISHNHPSGNLAPSEQDIKLTKKIKAALEFMDMSLVDHLIVSPEFKFLSFVNEGLLT